MALSVFSYWKYVCVITELQTVTSRTLMFILVPELKFTTSTISLPANGKNEKTFGRLMWYSYPIFLFVADKN